MAFASDPCSGERCAGFQYLETVEYEAVIRGQLVDEDENPLAFTSFSVADGTKLLEMHKFCASPSQAVAYLNRQISKAQKTVNRGQKIDRKRKVVGRRAEIRVNVEGSHDKDWAVMWTDGSDFYELLSQSLCHILELERRLTP